MNFWRGPEVMIGVSLIVPGGGVGGGGGGGGKKKKKPLQIFFREGGI